MKFIFISCISLITFLSTGQQVIDKVVAQVGENIVLKSDIEAQKIQALQAGVELSKDTECSILEELMYQYLLLNQAKLDSIEISDAQVDAEMESKLRVIEQQIGGRKKLEEFYGKTVNQIKKEFRDIIRDQLLAKEMELQIVGDLDVSPREVRAFYNSIPKDSLPLINMRMKFQQIVYYPEITSEDKLRAFKKLEEIRKAIIEDGKSFATQARIHSDDPGTASKGGEISGTRGMMVAPFEAALFRLDIGEISEVFETEYGYHIVQLIDRKGDDYTVRHILIIPRFANDALEKAALKMDTCYQRLKKNEITWDEAVRIYSNDVETKENKGLIINPITGEQDWDMEDLGQVDQQIYLLTKDMEEGDISQPNLYTNFINRKQGVRIVRLMQIKPPHRANLKDDYTLIQQAAKNEKKMRIIKEWTEQKIKSTYIQIDNYYNDCRFKYNWLKK